MSIDDQEASLQRIETDYGLTDYNRRLSDKILNAFNHACAVGRTDVAEHLQRALSVCVTGESDDRNMVALSKADLWREFVVTRDHYRDLRAVSEADAPAVQEALEAMKSAYMTWSEQ